MFALVLARRVCPAGAGASDSLHTRQLHTPEAFAGYLSTFPASVQPALAAKYTDTPGDAEDVYQNCAGAKLLADQLFVLPVWDQAVALSAHGSERARVWMYRCRAQVDRISRGPIKLGAM